MNTHYTATAKTLHWLMAVLLLGTLSVGWYMTDLGLSPLKLQLYSWHKWAGVTAWWLLLLRLIWRHRHPPPPLPDTMPAMQQTLAHAGHLLLYLLMFSIPVSGWLMSSAKGFQTVYFGVLPLPDVIEKSESVADMLGNLHGLLNLLLLAVLAAHIAAALKHHFIDRDAILRRMLPNFGKKTP